LTGRSRDEACAALDRANGSVKVAVLLLHGCDPDRAADLLDRAAGQLGKALELLKAPGSDAA
jgi:N-acetylmuramic acid 6-phosphate etherase